MKASAKVAVLGFVLQRPSYGYELVARFQRVFGELAWAWVVSPATIYKGLNELEAEGLIEAFDPGTESSTSRQPKTHYRATASGARTMREWLERPLPIEPSQAELLIRLSSGAELNPDGLALALAEHAAACRRAMDEIASAEHDSSLRRLVLERRRLAVQAQLAWIEFALAELRSGRDARTPQIARDARAE